MLAGGTFTEKLVQVFGADGRKKSHSFHRVVFRSAAKLSYQQAQAAIDGRPHDKTGPILDPSVFRLPGTTDLLLVAV